MEEPSFHQWPQLLDDIKLIIIPILDLRTRRHLRSCSRKDKELVENFAWREILDFRLEFWDGWCCQYNCTNDNIFYNAKEEEITKERFNTCEEAQCYMRKIIKTAKRVTVLKLMLEGNSKVSIRDGDKLIDVKDLQLEFRGGKDDGSKYECYNFLFGQIRPFSLESVYIVKLSCISDNPMYNDDFFELERTMMNLRFFDFDGFVSDEQLLGLRAKRAMLWSCASITPAGFLRYIKKLVLNRLPLTHVSLEQIGPELQTFLFGKLWTEDMFDELSPFEPEFQMNVYGSARTKVNISFYFQEERATIEVLVHQPGPFDGDLEDHPHFINDKTLQKLPGLRNFVRAMHQRLPQRFRLMRFLRRR